MVVTAPAEVGKPGRPEELCAFGVSNGGLVLGAGNVATADALPTTVGARVTGSFSMAAGLAASSGLASKNLLSHWKAALFSLLYSSTLMG